VPDGHIPAMIGVGWETASLASGCNAEKLVEVHLLHHRRAKAAFSLVLLLTRRHLPPSPVETATEVVEF
jgi:hypothetical protein